LRALGLHLDADFILEAKIAPTLREYRAHLGMTDPSSLGKHAEFIQQLNGLKIVNFEGGSHDADLICQALRAHAGTLEKMVLQFNGALEIYDIATKILRTPGNVLKELRLIAPNSDTELPEFVQALSSNSSYLRTLSFTRGNGKIIGLREAIPKTLIRHLGYLAAEPGFCSALRADWFRVLEALLSASTIKRLSTRAHVRMVPIPDMIARIAQTLGWPLKRASQI
jgi:hypothetical protein